MEVLDNKNQHRFELPSNGFVAFAEYILNTPEIIIYKTHIPGALAAHNGFSLTFVKEVVKMCSANGFVIDAQCPFFRALMKREIADG